MVRCKITEKNSPEVEHRIRRYRKMLRASQGKRKHDITLPP